MDRIVFFKAETLDEDEDPYCEKFKSKLKTVVVPTLEFQFVNLELLSQKLLVPDNYSGVICTSPRCVQAIRKSLSNEVVSSKWSKLSNFVIGEATHSQLLDVGFACSGSNTGNAELLADLILQKKFVKPFLYPCGSLSTDTLTTRLQAGGIITDTIVVYKTEPNTKLNESLEQLTNNSGLLYFVFFSPSGVKFTLPLLKQRGILIDKVKFVAIGPATEKELLANGLVVAAVAKKPNPDSLYEAIFNS